jgi:hypothetical protein
MNGGGEKKKQKAKSKKQNKNCLFYTKWKALQQDYIWVELKFGTNLIHNLTWFYKCTIL